MPTITRGRGRPRLKPSSKVKGSRGSRPDRRDVHRTTLPGDPTICTTVPTEMGEDNARFDPTGEPDEAKVSSPVRRGAAETGPHGNRADRPPYVRRASIMSSLVQQVATRSLWQGRPAYRRPKGRKGPQHAGQSKKRREAGADQATASRDPYGMAKAGLLEAQSSAVDKATHRYVG
jgi:hypothetical protein